MVTDIIIDPFCQAFLPTLTDLFLVVVELGGRPFRAGFVGTATQHYSLTSGYVVPEGGVVTARNTTSSDFLVEIQVLGYFVTTPFHQDEKPDK